MHLYCTDFAWQAKAACFYIMKYVVKDGNQLANVLSLIKKADEHLEAHP